MKYGLIKVAASIPGVRVADTEYNVQQIESLIAQAEGKGAELLVLPELCLTGYTCQDLFRQDLLLDKAEEALLVLLDFTRKLDVISVVGLPVRIGSLLYNCAAVIQRGTLMGLVAKTYLPNNGEFYEGRWFASSTSLQPQDIYLAGSPVRVTPAPQLFRTCDGVCFGIEIGEDAWAPQPPGNQLALLGADIVVNPSASNEIIGRSAYLHQMLAQQSARTLSGYLYASCGYGESTQDVVFGGNAMIFENGHLLVGAQPFQIDPQLIVQQVDVDCLRSERQNNSLFRSATQSVAPSTVTIDMKQVEPRDFELIRPVSAHPFIPSDDELAGRCEEILNIQMMGIVKRLQHTHCDKAVIGLDGGLGSTLALLVTIRAFDRLGLSRRGIIGIAMTGAGTNDRLHADVILMMDQAGITSHEPTTALTDVAVQVGALLIGTCHLSELALGWYYDKSYGQPMYALNAGVPRTIIPYLLRHLAQMPVFNVLTSLILDVVEKAETPVQQTGDAETGMTQKAEDLVGPYELHDFFLFFHLRLGFRPAKIFMLACHAFNGKYDESTIKQWLQTFCRRFFNQQFLRSSMPDSPKVGSVCLSPRGDWRMATDASSALWLKECEAL